MENSPSRTWGTSLANFRSAWLILVVPVLLGVLIFASYRVRTALNLVAFKKVMLFPILSPCSETNVMVISGKNFFLLLGLPKGTLPSEESALGTVTVKGPSGAMYEKVVDTNLLTSASWLDEQNLDGYVIAFERDGDLKLMPNTEYRVRFCSESAPIGCSLWLHYAIPIRQVKKGQKEVLLKQSTTRE